MTKTIKKGFIAVLMLVLAVCSVFATLNVKSSHADELPANVTAFNTNMAAFEPYKEADFTTGLAAAKEEILGNNDLTKKYNDARVLYTETMTPDEKGQITIEVKNLYDKIALVFSDAIRVYSYNNADLFKALYGTGVKYSMKALFDENKGIYDAMTGVEKTYTESNMKPSIFYGEVKTALDAIETQAALAVTAIGNIEYLVGADMKVPAVDETGTIVYDSKASMDAALAALNAIYKTAGGVYVPYETWKNDATEKAALKTIITNLDDYEAAVTAWAGLQAQADTVANEINTLYDGAYNTDGSYKNKDEINTASTNFEGLNTTHNDLRNLVDVDTKAHLDEMKDALAAQEANIATANGMIAALIAESTVDVNNGVYTTACKDKIDDVTIYIVAANFDQYILDNKATIFTDYDKYVSIKEEYEAKKAAIDTLKGKLMDIKADASNVSADFEEAKTIYLSFVPNQVSEFEGTAISPAITYSYTANDGTPMNITCNNYKDLYVAIRAHAEDVISAAQIIIAKINALDLTTFDLPHYQAATAVDGEYKAATEAVQHAVSNYDKLKNYLDTFATILDGAKTWAAMPIPDTVTYADCIAGGQVYAKIAAWNSLDSLLREYVAATTETEYQTAYVKFMNAKKASEIIVGTDGNGGLVKAAKDAVAAVETVTEPFTLAVGAATTDFVNHVNAATAALEALKTAGATAELSSSINYDATDAVAAIFSTDGAAMKAEYENYKKALDKLPSFEVEAAIDALFTGTTYAEAQAVIKLASEFDETDAMDVVTKEGIASLLAKVQNITVRGYYYNGADVNGIINGTVTEYGKLDAAYAALTALKNGYDKFINDVKALAETKEIADNIVKIDLVKLGELNTKYTVLVGSPADTYVVEYLKGAKAILDALVERNANLVVDFAAKINTVKAKDLEGKIAEVKDDIIWVQTTFNTFTDSQKAQFTAEEKEPSVYKTVEEKYGEFANISKKFQYSEYFTAAVGNLKVNFNVEGKLTNEGYIQVKTLLAMYNMAAADIQALLVEPYADLTEIAKKYDAEGAEFTDINKVAANLEAAKTEFEGQIATINGLIDNLEQADIDNKNEVIATLNTAKTELQGKIDTINTTLANLTAKDTELAGKIEDIVKAGGTLDTVKAAIENAYKAADEDLEADYKAADEAIKGTVESYKTALETAIQAEQAAREAAIQAEKEAREAAIKAANDAREAAIKAEAEAREAALKAANDAREAAIKAEAEAREAAVKAANEAREAETKKLHNAIVTISIIFSIVMVALAACVFVLFLKKKA